MSGSPGYQALRNDAARLDLSARGVIRVTGEDRDRLLHAMCTNHIQQLKPGQGCYAFFLTAQGKIVADANILCFEDHFLLDIEPESREKLYQHLDKFIIADDVTLEDVSGTAPVTGIEGPHATDVLARAGAPVPDEPFHHARWGESIIARISFTGGSGYRIFGLMPAELAISDATLDDARIVRLEHFQPRFGEDIFETTLPMETQQSHSIHYNKGCYIGQEIVERVRSRGHVNRVLAGLVLEGETPPEKGTPTRVNDVECGRITSAVYSPAEGKIVALAYMRVPNQAPGTAVQVGELRGVTVPAGGQVQPVGC